MVWWPWVMLDCIPHGLVLYAHCPFVQCPGFQYRQHCCLGSPVVSIFSCTLDYYYYVRLTVFFFRTTWVSRRQKGKPFWILLEQEMMGWQWHQLDHMQITCTLLQTDNHASTSPLSFYRPDALPAAQPTVWKRWRLKLHWRWQTCIRTAMRPMWEIVKPRGKAIISEFSADCVTRQLHWMELFTIVLCRFLRA